MNLNCEAPKCHAMKDCWYEGGGSVHKAPEWWKAKRRTRSETSPKANVANVAKDMTEAANVTIDVVQHLDNRFEDSYKSYPCIYVGDDGVTLGLVFGMT